MTSTATRVDLVTMPTSKLRVMCLIQRVKANIGSCRFNFFKILLLS